MEDSQPKRIRDEWITPIGKFGFTFKYKDGTECAKGGNTSENFEMKFDRPVRSMLIKKPTTMKRTPIRWIDFQDNKGNRIDGCGLYNAGFSDIEEDILFKFDEGYEFIGY